MRPATITLVGCKSAVYLKIPVGNRHRSGMAGHCQRNRSKQRLKRLMCTGIRVHLCLPKAVDALI
ncbi:hypothetical protein SDC9_171524 [bioreactor metagenome]|uniref:Uncharacterized protein n=1 Tax=bioreactor metagenome TaxID=1076179 RepID=A0A645GDH7_9ZZZZ